MCCKYKTSGLIAIALKLQSQNKYNTQGGFTIIESLIAIIVVAILMTAIAPVIVLSSATRLQSRRAELASRAAKAYIDGVSAGSIPAPQGTVNPGEPLNNFPVPTTLNDLYCFDVDGGECGKNLEGELSNKDLRVQAFRTAGEAVNGFSLGIRVYRNDALQNGGSLQKSDPNKKLTQKTFGTLINKTAPLDEITTDIAPDRKITTGTDFAKLCERIKNNGYPDSTCYKK